MEVLLIDVGALAMFLAYMGIVYWHGVSQEAAPASRIEVSTVDRPAGHGERSEGRVRDRGNCEGRVEARLRTPAATGGGASWQVVSAPAGAALLIRRGPVAGIAATRSLPPP